MKSFDGVGKAWCGVRGHLRPIADACGATARVKNDMCKWEKKNIGGMVRRKGCNQGESSGEEVQWCWMTVSKDTLLLTGWRGAEGAWRHPRVLIRQTHMSLGCGIRIRGIR